MTQLAFRKQNFGWNADPNAPEPRLTIANGDLILVFHLNPYREPFQEGQGQIRFRNCSRFRSDGTNDHAWFGGQCRYGRAAPQWGEFYELVGDDPTLIEVNDWIRVAGSDGTRHFLFYFRDEMVECLAESWILEDDNANPLTALKA